MAKRRPGARPIGPNRRFALEPVMRETPDLHKLTQVFVNLAVAQAKNDPALTRGKGLQEAASQS
jgi:hypothetical protein